MRQCHDYDIVKLFQAMQVVCENFSARRRIILVSIAVSCTNALQGNSSGCLSSRLLECTWVAHCSTTENMLHGTSEGGRKLILRFMECFWAWCLQGPHSWTEELVGWQKPHSTLYCELRYCTYRSIFNWSKQSPPLIFAKVWGTECWWSGGCLLVWDSSASFTEWPNGLLSRQRTFAIPDIDDSYF